MEQTELLEQRDGFCFFRSWWKAVECLPDEQAWLLTHAIMRYSFTGVAPELPKGILQALWESWLPTINRNMAQYLNGKKGGGQIGNQNAKKRAKKEPETSQKRTNLNLKENINLNTKRVNATFVAPTLKDVEDYCEENKLPHNVAEPFFYYYDAMGWKTNRGASIKNWHSALRGWIAREPDLQQHQAAQQARRTTEVKAVTAADYEGKF